jgi:hypothetical protein
LPGGVGVAVDVTKIFNAFLTVYSSPHAVGMITMIHAAAMRRGDDFLMLESAMRWLLNVEKGGDKHSVG